MKDVDLCVLRRRMGFYVNLGFNAYLMKKGQRLWTREEFILVLNLYLKLPFGKLDARTKEVKYLAGLINRTPGSVSMRLNNFASVDPFHQKRGVSGLSGGGKQVKPYWDEFMGNKDELLFESEILVAQYEKRDIEDKYHDELDDITNLSGEDKIKLVKTRVNQVVFRNIVLSNYNYKCAISGLPITELLVASHIIPWSENKIERLNPENGICLSPLYDKAFDKGYIGINNNFQIVLSNYLKLRIKEKSIHKNFISIDGLKISVPRKYPPKLDFLKYHYDVIFKK